MTNKDLLKLTHRLEIIANSAGKYALSKLWRKKVIRNKNGQALNLVTEVDVACEAMICQQLTRHYPEIGIVAEEGTARKSSGAQDGLYFHIDPIDGTSNYAHGLPFFAVSIGLCKGSEALAGVIEIPYLRETFSATRGRGAFLNGKRIHVSKQNDLSRSLLASGFPYDRRENPNNNLDRFARMTLGSQGVRRVGAACIDLAYVAAGRFDGYWELRLNSWDVAAGMLLVKEAGGKVSNFKGDTFSFDDLDIVASNGILQNALLKKLRVP